LPRSSNRRPIERPADRAGFSALAATLGSVDFVHLAIASVAALLAGAVNSVAGGGTMITFPTLLWLGLPSVIANATNTLAIWPGTVGSVFGFRRELRQTDRVMFTLIAPSVVGGAIGALLLRYTPSAVFDKIVPGLILFATLLFTVQGTVQKKLKTVHAQARRSGPWLWGAILLQLLVGVYGGYFGAGMSIMALAVLGVLGMTDILQMNGLTSLLGLCVNGIAAALFIAAHMVYWPYVLAMAASALIGGYGAAGIARRVGRTVVRRCVVVVGFAMALVLFIRVL